MTDRILADTPELTSSGSSLKNHTTYVQQQRTTIQTALGNASGALSASSLLASAAFGLDSVSKGMGDVLQCEEEGLLGLGNGLHTTASHFQQIDADMANMFNAMDKSLQPYTGFESSPPPAPAKPKSKSGSPSWWDRTVDITEGVGLGLAGAGAVVLGGGPEDPVGDAAAVAAESEAADLIGAGVG